MTSLCDAVAASAARHWPDGRKVVNGFLWRHRFWISKNKLGKSPLAASDYLIYRPVVAIAFFFEMATAPPSVLLGHSGIIVLNTFERMKFVSIIKRCCEWCEWVGNERESDKNDLGAWIVSGAIVKSQTQETIEKGEWRISVLAFVFVRHLDLAVKGGGGTKWEIRREKQCRIHYGASGARARGLSQKMPPYKKLRIFLSTEWSRRRPEEYVIIFLRCFAGGELQICFM